MSRSFVDFGHLAGQGRLYFVGTPFIDILIDHERKVLFDNYSRMKDPRTKQCKDCNAWFWPKAGARSIRCVNCQEAKNEAMRREWRRKFGPKPNDPGRNKGTWLQRAGKLTR